jgi:hypothetical protein
MRGHGQRHAGGRAPFMHQGRERGLGVVRTPVIGGRRMKVKGQGEWGVLSWTRPLRAVRRAVRGRDCRGQVALADSRRPRDVRVGSPAAPRRGNRGTPRRKRVRGVVWWGTTMLALSRSASEGGRGLPTVNVSVAESAVFKLQKSQGVRLHSDAEKGSRSMKFATCFLRSGELAD